MRRYWLTDRLYQRTEPSRVLTKGWNTTRLMLVAAARVTSSSTDRGFTLADLTQAVDVILRQHAISFVGRTSDQKDYLSEGERIVRGRFGDMRRSGYFSADMPQLACRPARYDSRNNVQDRLDEWLRGNDPPLADLSSLVRGGRGRRTNPPVPEPAEGEHHATGR